MNHGGGGRQHVRQQNVSKDLRGGRWFRRKTLGKFRGESPRNQKKNNSEDERNDSKTRTKGGHTKYAKEGQSDMGCGSAFEVKRWESKQHRGPP